MKVYVIEKGQYSDRHIIAVSDSPEKAEEIRAAVSGKYRGEEATITEYDTNQFANSVFRYEVIEDYNDIWRVKYDDWNLNWQYPESCHAYADTYIVYAKNPDQAIKIAQDIKAQRKAEEEGVAL